MPSPITKVVIIYLENHTFDNVASEVPGTDGDRSLPPAPDPPHDDAASMLSHVRSANVSLVAYIERLFGLPPSPNPDAARRTSAPDERAMADYIDTGQTPLPPG